MNGLPVHRSEHQAEVFIGELRRMAENVESDRPGTHQPQPRFDGPPGAARPVPLSRAIGLGDPVAKLDIELPGVLRVAGGSERLRHIAPVTVTVQLPEPLVVDRPLNGSRVEKKVDPALRELPGDVDLLHLAADRPIGPLGVIPAPVGTGTQQVLRPFAEIAGDQAAGLLRVPGLPGGGISGAEAVGIEIPEQLFEVQLPFFRGEFGERRSRCGGQYAAADGGGAQTGLAEIQHSVSSIA